MTSFMESAILKEAASTYVEVTLEDVEKLLKRSFHSMHPKRGVFRGVYFFDLEVSDYVAIRVTSSVTVEAGVGRDVGEQSFKTLFVSKRSGNSIVDRGTKSPRVYRTTNWRTNLQDMVEDFIEKYEDEPDKWDGRAGARIQRQPEPEQKSEYERARDEDGEGDDGSEPGYTEVPKPPGPSRKLSETAQFGRCSNGDWGIAVQDAEAKEGDTVVAQRRDGATSTVTLGQFDRAQYGKRFFYMGKQVGQQGYQKSRNQGYGYDRRRRY